MSDHSLSAAKPGMLCPVCRVELVMSERQNIEVDYCPQCRGVWLDRGELDKIIERSVQPQAQQAARPAPAHDERARYGHDERHGYGDRHGRRRKSWLEELFD